MKNIYFIFLLLVALPVVAHAQYTGGKGSGDVSLAHFRALGINDFKDQGFSMNVFPNPTGGFIQLAIETNQIEALSYQLFDFNGKLIFHQKIKNKETSISLGNLPSASYFLRVTDHNKALRTFRIIKN